MTTPEPKSQPQHVAVIMDGNGRWAKSHGLPRLEGHRRGGDAVRRTLQACQDLDIKYLTLFAFSSENWSRPAGEVSGLMGLLVTFLRREVDQLVKNNVRLHVIGEWEKLPENARNELDRALEKTVSCDRWHLTLALNYGSRQEIVAAARAFAEAVQRGEVNPSDASWEVISRNLFTRDLPDPDLIIRTSGESRLSNFLMLQGAYAELYFSKVHWPDFGAEHLREAVEFFKTRERRYGKTSEQLQAAPAATQ